MKRKITLLSTLALLLFVVIGKASAANGDLVHINQLADEGITVWKNEYTSVRGERIQVDVEIVIPDADVFPCLEAEYSDPSSVLPTTKKNAESTLKNDFEFSNFKGQFVFAWPSRTEQSKMIKTSKKNGSYLSISGEPRHLIMAYGQFKNDIPYAVNNPTTVDTASAMLNEYTQQYFGWLNISFIPRYVEAHIDPGKYKYNKQTGDYDKVEDTPDFEGCLFVRYDQLIDNIPVLGYSYDGMFDLNRATEALGMLGADVITQGMHYLGSDDLYRHVVIKLLQVSKITRIDVPLVPVSKVIQAAEEYIMDGKLRSVDCLRLGYVAWLNKDGSFKLMPTWVIAGEVFPDAQTGSRFPKNIFDEKPIEYQYLYINAQTGEVIDPSSKAKDRAYRCPKLITWN